MSFKRVWNITTGILIRDLVRAELKEQAYRDAEKDRKKAIKKLNKEKENENYFQSQLLEENKWRNDFDKKAREWEIAHEREYLEKVYDANHSNIQNIEKYEIKEWIKSDTNWMEYPENKLKFLDNWDLSIWEWRVVFSGSAKDTIIKYTEIKDFKIYKNWILLQKNRGKNVFFKVDSSKYDTNKFWDILSWHVAYIDKDEWDSEMMLKIAKYLTNWGNSNWNLDLLDMADSVWSTVLDCARLTKKLEAQWVVKLFSDDWKSTKSIDDIRKEKWLDVAPRYDKFWHYFSIVAKRIVILIWGILLLFLTISLLASFFSN